MKYKKGDINRKTWPNKRSPAGLQGCTAQDRESSMLAFGVRVACDEYPFSASMQGGYNNFLSSGVSGCYIPLVENRDFGFKILSRLEGMQQGDYYIAAPSDVTWSSMMINKP